MQALHFKFGMQVKGIYDVLGVDQFFFSITSIDNRVSAGHFSHMPLRVLVKRKLEDVEWYSLVKGAVIKPSLLLRKKIGRFLQGCINNYFGIMHDLLSNLSIICSFLFIDSITRS